MSTLHVSDARNIPDKIVNALGLKQDTERVMNQVHNDVGIAVLLKKKITDDQQIRRYIDQICVYFRQEGINGTALILENGTLYPGRIPAFLRAKIEKELGRTLCSSPF